jgi:uncharacterized SAM-binding protein YcdF (DUF218 family)
MYHFIKQCAGAFAAPLAIAMLVAAVAAGFRLSGRRRIAGWLCVAAAAVVYLGAVGRVGDALLGPLERQYPPLQDGALPAVSYVVVLGSGYEPRDGIAVTAALDEDGLVRIVEAVRLVRHLGAVHLVVSGGAPPGQAAPALGYAELAREFGVDGASLALLSESLDTGAEARGVARLVRSSPFLLVTSAYHMPRAMRLMQRAGAHPIAAPAGQLVNQSARNGWRSWLPSSDGLGKSERALHEYLGLAVMAAGVER